MPIGEHDHSSQLERIRTARPDVVLITLIGADSVVFNRAFAEQGLGSRMLRSGRRDACAMDETVLFGIGADNTENLFCASGYFIDMAWRETPPSAPIPSVVRPPRTAARLDRAVKLRRVAVSGDGRSARRIAGEEAAAPAAANVDYQGARGSIGIRRGSARMPIYLAAANGLYFRLIKQF